MPYTRGGLIACDGDAYKLGHLDYGSSHFAGIIQARCRTVIKVSESYSATWIYQYRCSFPWTNLKRVYSVIKKLYKIQDALSAVYGVV